MLQKSVNVCENNSETKMVSTLQHGVHSGNSCVVIAHKIVMETQQQQPQHQSVRESPPPPAASQPAAGQLPAHTTMGQSNLVKATSNTWVKLGPPSNTIFLESPSVSSQAGPRSVQPCLYTEVT